MSSYPFIFSDRYRLKRHFLFWSSWWVFQSILYSYVGVSRFLPPLKRLPISATEAVVYLIPHMFMAYTLMYLVVPQLLLKGKYLLTALSVIIIIFLTAVISALLGFYAMDSIRAFILPDWLNSSQPRFANFSFFLSLLAGLRGGITIGGMAAAIKLMKYLYIKEQRNLQLQKENTESQLQLLKAQVHPHFLFNTLNNIYSYTQNTSPVASQLVMGLSDMLRCMLYECDQKTVPLNTEIKLLRDYITLEKIRYGNRLDISIDVPEDAASLHVAPLLLLPFVENSFKHGTSQVIEQPWMSLHIQTCENKMHMRLLNGKQGTIKPNPAASGIGIQNVQRRLALQYPDKHSLKITNDAEVFIVDLKLELERKISTAKTVKSPKTEVAYE